MRSARGRSVSFDAHNVEKVGASPIRATGGTQGVGEPPKLASLVRVQDFPPEVAENAVA